MRTPSKTGSTKRKKNNMAAKMNTAPGSIKMMPDKTVEDIAVGPTSEILGGEEMGGDDMVTIPRMALDDAVAAFDALKAAIDEASGVGQEELPLPTAPTGATGATGPDNSPEGLANEISGMRKNSY
jgi:hypothetical protein